MVKFFVGALAGVALSFLFVAFGPNGTESKARAAGKVVMEKAEETRFSICQRQFLDETHCFQNLPSAQCVTLIKEKCGEVKSARAAPVPPSALTDDFEMDMGKPTVTSVPKETTEAKAVSEAEQATIDAVGRPGSRLARQLQAGTEIAPPSTLSH